VKNLKHGMDAQKMFMSLILIIHFFPFGTSLDTLTPNQSIKDGQSLISKENTLLFCPNHEKETF
jgi:hypothetical protein